MIKSVSSRSSPQDGSRTDPQDFEQRALTGVFAILRAWQVPLAQQRALLGDPAERTFRKWKAGEGGRLSRDTLTRIGLLAGIYKALQILYSDPVLADTWPLRPNRAFAGQTPLARMAAGEVMDLVAVRDYLDAARSPWS